MHVPDFNVQRTVPPIPFALRLKVTCGPITAEPLDLSISDARPATRGKLLIPLTEAQSQEKRLRPKNSNSSSIAVGGAMGENQGSGRDVVSNAQDEDPVEFVHITRPGRNYVVLQVGTQHAIWLVYSKPCR